MTQYQIKHYRPRLERGYTIFDENGNVYKDGLTHSEAWELMDRLSGEHTSIKERAAEWGFNKNSGRL